MKLDTRTRLLASTLLVGAALVAQPAFAQDTSTPAAVGAPTSPPATPPAGIQTPESTAGQTGAAADTASSGEIVVTGSLIRNPNLTSASPVASIGQEEITLRQANTAEQILRDLPGAVPSIGSAVNNGNGGASYVDLRGLGSIRNVVLLDGQRIVPGDLSGRVDLNNIPLALVERTDVLTGGAATTYGADAVSGVVNFITRKDFSGLEVNVSDALTQKGDGNYVRADVTLGANFDDGRGNAVFSIGYQQSDPVYQGDRSFSVNNIDSFSGLPGGSGTSIPSRFSRVGNGTQQIDASGTLVPTYATFNFNPYNIFQTPFERFNMFGAAHYEVSDAVEVYTRGLFSKNDVKTIIAPSGIFGSSLTIPVSNPYLPAAARAQFCASQDFNPTLAGTQPLTPAQCAAAATATSPTDPNYRTFTTTVSRRTTEVGPRISDFQTTIFDYKVGAIAHITDKIDFDLSGAYGESENIQSLQGYVLTSKVRDAVLATNTTTCLSGNAGCVPLNIFGPAGSITPAMITYITSASTTTIKNSLAQVRGLFTGDFGVTIPLASDPISFAAGGEYRKYQTTQRSDSLAKIPGELGGAGGAAPDITGGYDVYEAYGELVAPLISDKPFFHSLSVGGGVRYSSYKVFAPSSPSFKTTTYKGEVNWSPVEEIKLRGTYQHAVRAPNVGELFSPQNTGLTNLAVDPCAGAAPVNNATLRAVCLAQGAPASTIGNILNPTAGQANATGGGNLNLVPETSNSYTAGLVLQPTSVIPGFSATVDYFNIKVKGAVSSPTPGDVIAACFGNLSATSDACTSIRRNPVTGGLDGDVATTPGLPLVSSNLGRIATDGVDLGLNYRHDIGFAVLNLSFRGTWTDKNKFQASPTSLNRDCVGYYSVNCGSIQPKYQWTQRTTLTFGPMDLSLQWRHIDKVKQEPDDVLNGNGPAFGSFGRIKSYDYFNLATRFEANDHLEMTVTVNNLGNRKPPVVGSTIGSVSYNSGNTYPSTYDALGRAFAVGAKVKF